MNPAFAVVVSQTLKSYYNADHKKMEHEIGRYSLFFVGLGGLSIFGYFGQHFFFGIMGDNLVKRVREKMFAGESIINYIFLTDRLFSAICSELGSFPSNFWWYRSRLAFKCCDPIYKV